MIQFLSFDISCALNIIYFFYHVFLCIIQRIQNTRKIGRFQNFCLFNYYVHNSNLFLRVASVIIIIGKWSKVPWCGKAFNNNFNIFFFLLPSLNVSSSSFPKSSENSEPAPCSSVMTFSNLSVALEAKLFSDCGRSVWMSSSKNFILYFTHTWIWYKCIRWKAREWTSAKMCTSEKNNLLQRQLFCFHV